MGNPLKILYITFEGICGSLGRSQVLPYLVGLSKKSYKVTILSAEKPKEYKAYEQIVQSIVSENGINWVRVEYFNKPPIIGPFLLKQKITKKAEQLHLREKFDVVHCRSYLSSMIGMFLKQKYDTKFIFDMRGFWADERVDGKIWNRKNPVYNIIYQYFKKQEKKLLLNADYIVTLTHTAKEIIHNRGDVNGKKLKIKVVPCCVDLNKFVVQKVNLQKKESYKTKLQISDTDFVLSYLGSMGTWYMLNEMLDFFKVLEQENENAKFLFISKEKDLIEKTCTAKNINLDKIIVQAVSYDDVPTLLSLSKVAIFFILPYFSKKASSPVKQGEIMAMQIPIICNSGVGDTDYVINKYHAGVLVNNFTEKDYKKAINNYYNTTFSKQEIRKGAEEFYGLENGVESYSEIYLQVTS